MCTISNWVILNFVHLFCIYVGFETKNQFLIFNSLYLIIFRIFLQTILPVCSLPRSSQVRSYQPGIRSILREIRERRRRNGENPRLDRYLLSTGRNYSALSCSGHYGGSKWFCCHVYHNVQTRSRLVLFFKYSTI